uniref:Putative secreted protein n=1 Tax=Ixodes ricinus TaxID=34613 RepID=A0A6B0V4L2_IXORI
MAFRWYLAFACFSSSLLPVFSTTSHTLHRAWYGVVGTFASHCLKRPSCSHASQNFCLRHFVDCTLSALAFTVRTMSSVVTGSLDASSLLTIAALVSGVWMCAPLASRGPAAAVVATGMSATAVLPSAVLATVEPATIELAVKVLGGCGLAMAALNACSSAFAGMWSCVAPMLPWCGRTDLTASSMGWGASASGISFMHPGRSSPSEKADNSNEPITFYSSCTVKHVRVQVLLLGQISR